MTALDEYVSGKDVYNLGVFKHSSILPLQKQYAHEAKLIYGDTKTYKEFEENLENLSPDEQASLFSEFEQNMESIFRKMATCVHQSPASDDVQQLITAWKSVLGQTIGCDSEMLTCIANTYKSDPRFQNYINQFSDENLAEFLYHAIMHHISQMKS